METFFLYEGIICLFNSKVMTPLPLFFFLFLPPQLPPVKKKEKKRKHSNCQRQLLQMLYRSILVSINRFKTSSFYPRPWPEERAFIIADFCVHLIQKKVSGTTFATALKSRECSSPRIGPSLTLAFILFILASRSPVLSPCSPLLTYSSLLCIIPAPLA